MADTATTTDPAADCATAVATAAAPPASIPGQRRTIALDVHTPGGLEVWEFPLARHVQAVLDTGVHPATRQAIHPDASATCGTCAHAVERPVADGEQRTRCALSASRRKGPDLLPTFPGCTSHTPRPEGSQS
jgi:hypothetical protein